MWPTNSLYTCDPQTVYYTSDFFTNLGFRVSNTSDFFTNTSDFFTNLGFRVSNYVAHKQSIIRGPQTVYYTCGPQTVYYTFGPQTV